MPAPVSPTPQPPPNPGISRESVEWDDWFYKLYQMLLEDGGVFPVLRVQGKEGTASFTADKNMFQRLLSLDSGLYVDYYSDNGNIIYGYAANVRRSGGNNLTVAAQLNAWAPKGGNGAVFGIATTALGADLFTGPLIGMETTPANVYHDNRAAKVGLDAVFKDRGDGATTVNGLGSDRYNYYSSAHWITSQPRSSTGERCGWTRGISFLGECLDSQVPPAWNAAVIYATGMVVTSGGLAWQAIQPSVNQAPAVPSAFWVQHTPAGTAALAIGIDFSSLPVGTLARISSAIRLRDTMRIDYDTTGNVGSYFDPATALMRLVNLGAANRFAVDVGSGEFSIVKALDAPGGGAAAALATIGGAGPTAAPQQGWLRMQHAGLGNVWVPVWI